MKLINFLKDSKLNSIRKKMNADLVIWKGNNEWNHIDPFGFRRTLKEEGEVDIPFDEIDISSDGTFQLFGKKVLVYIRDQRAGTQYKFHICDCRTLREARLNNRYKKYVASINTNGIFIVNTLHRFGYTQKNIKVKMKVCKNCLSKLNYERYKYRYSERDHICDSFSINDFFKQYQQHDIVQPDFTNLSAPLNEYPKDFKKISQELKIKNKFVCEECNVDLSDNPQFLHTHHIDGQKWNSKPNNLKTICIECHSTKPEHWLKSHPDYFEFQRLYR